jgi:cyclic pyranopterin phosphate synthase
VLKDGFGRTLDYLRVSVTAACNLACAYCRVPGVASTPRDPAGELSDDELVFLVSCFTGLGVSRVRLTGGEPLRRPGLAGLVDRLARLPGIEDLALSTNGLGLAPLARALRRAGLSRVNVSLDSLRDDRFREITGRDGPGAVLAGIEAALSAGLDPVKVNCVVARGVNDDEIAAFADLPSRLRVHVRFIELMPQGGTRRFAPERMVPFAEMLERAAPLEPLPRPAWPRGGGPARYYMRPGAIGSVGFITPLSARFCASCNRLRLDATGRLVTCLDGSAEVDLRGFAAGREADRVMEAIRAAVARKPRRHFMVERAAGTAGGAERPMWTTGG